MRHLPSCVTSPALRTDWQAYRVMLSNGRVGELSVVASLLRVASPVPNTIAQSALQLCTREIVELSILLASQTRLSCDGWCGVIPTGNVALRSNRFTHPELMAGMVFGGEREST